MAGVAIGREGCRNPRLAGPYVQGRGHEWWVLRRHGTAATEPAGPGGADGTALVGHQRAAMRPALAELSPRNDKVAGTSNAARYATARMRRGEEEVRVLSLAQVRSGCGVRRTAPCGG